MAFYDEAHKRLHGKLDRIVRYGRATDQQLAYFTFCLQKGWQLWVRSGGELNAYTPQMRLGRDARGHLPVFILADPALVSSPDDVWTCWLLDTEPDWSKYVCAVLMTEDQLVVLSTLSYL